MGHGWRMLAVVLGSVSVAGTVHSQQASVFRTTVDLASLAVTVSDDVGRPIEGLRPDEFIITVNEQKTAVELLEYVRLDGRPSPRPNDQPGGAGAPQSMPTPPFRVVVFLVDDLSMPARPLRQVMQPVLELLSMLASDDVVGVVTTSGLGPALNPTRDRAAVEATLLDKRMAGRTLRRQGRFVISAQEAIAVESGAPSALDNLAKRECVNPDIGRTDPMCVAALEASAKQMALEDMYRSLQQLQAIERVVTALRGGPSPKVLVVLSSGLVLRAGQPELVQRLNALSQVASSAGVIIYGLGEATAFAGGMSDTQARARALREESVFLNEGLQTAVGATGGQSFLIVGQPKRFVQRIVSETSAYYRLGVRLPPEVRTGVVRVNVTTTRPGATARTNRDLIAPAGGAK